MAKGGCLVGMTKRVVLPCIRLIFIDKMVYNIGVRERGARSVRRSRYIKNERGEYYEGRIARRN